MGVCLVVQKDFVEKGKMNSVLIVVGLIVVIITVYLIFICPWQHRWGAMDEEVARPMLGDEIIQHPKVVKILDKKPQKEKKIIYLYYGLDEYSSSKHTMKEIADELGIPVKKVKTTKEDIEFQIKQSIFFDHLAY